MEGLVDGLNDGRISKWTDERISEWTLVESLILWTAGGRISG